MGGSPSSQAAFDSNEGREFTEPCTFSTSNYVNRLLSTYINSVICLVGFVGNIVVILTFALEKKGNLQKAQVFQLNLAIANLLFIKGLPFLIYNELFSQSMGQVACKLLQGSYSINLYSGMFLIAEISVVHHIVTSNPLQARTSPLLMNSSIICVCIWVFALLLYVPTFYFYQLYEPYSEFYMVESEDENKTTTLPLYVCEFRLVKVAVPSTQMAVGYLLPLLILIFCYTSIVITLVKTKNRRHSSSNNEEKAIRNVTGIMLMFVICHLPYNIILLYDTSNMFKLMSCEEADRWQTALSITQSVAYLQCSLNPGIYSFMAKALRERFMNIFWPSTRTEKISAYIIVQGVGYL